MTDYAMKAGYNRKSLKNQATKRPAKQTSQRQRMPERPDMVKNNAGGYSFRANRDVRLMRFLILGVEGNSYYETATNQFQHNMSNMRAMINGDPHLVIDMVEDVITNNRAVKREPSLFVLALLASYKVELPIPTKTSNNFENLKAEYDAAANVRSRALSLLPTLIRIPTDLFTFFNYVKEMRGMGSSLRKSLANWYNSKPLNTLAYHSWKYKQRGGVSNRDILRLGHPKADDSTRAEIYNYMTKPKQSALTRGLDALSELDGVDIEIVSQIAAAEELLHLSKDDVARAVELIKTYRLTHEAVPGELKNSPDVWMALLENMPVAAMIRNLGKMSNIGILTTMSDGALMVTKKLRDVDAVRRSNIHPMTIYMGMCQYRMGHGLRGSLTWTPNQSIIDALEDAFYSAMDNVVPTNKRILVGIDTSGSMAGTWTQKIQSLDVSPAEAAMVMAMVILRTEPNAVVIGFDRVLVDVKLSKHTSLTEAAEIARKVNGGGTDTSLPFVYALKNNITFDAFVTLTDNETWAGIRSPLARMQQYTSTVNSDAKFLNMAFTANSVTDIDPKANNMMEMCGIDTSFPVIMNRFVDGKI